MRRCWAEEAGEDLGPNCEDLRIAAAVRNDVIDVCT